VHNIKTVLNYFYCSLTQFNLHSPAIKVLDPTFLLSKESYMNLCPKCKPLTSQPYVFIYSLNIQSCDDIRFEELNSYIQCQHLDLVVTPADGYTQGQELFGKQALYSYATVEQWLSNIVNSLLVVTASFHGVVLSIILERPFIYVPLSGSHSGSNGRILEVLNFLGLTDRILTADKTYKEIAQANINWKVVNDKLSQSKQESIEYLNKLLGVVVCKL
ncbi:polysaccharide pyruvyl transferase family protein, partial [Segatella copri]